MVGEVLSICLSVRHTLLCVTPQTILMWFEPNFHRMIVHQVPQCILSVFCNSIIYQGIIAFCLNLHRRSVRPSHSSVLNSSNSSCAIWTKLSQKDCHQVPQCILSVFCDSIIGQWVIAFCLNLLCAALLLQNDGHQMLQRILPGFCYSIFYQRVIALVLKFTLLSFCVQLLFCGQLLIQFLCDLNLTLTMVMVGEVPSVRPSHSSVRNSSYSSCAIWTKLSQNDCHQVPQCILSVFCNSIIYQGIIAFCLNLHPRSVRPSHSSVRNSSNSSYAIWTKLSQNDCHQVPQCILSVFCNSIIYPRHYCLLFKFTPSVCPSVTLFCAKLLKQFLWDLNQTFTEWLSPCAAAHIVIILWFLNLSRSYCPLFKFTLLSFCEQLLLQFLWDFYETFTEWWSPNAAAHIVSVCVCVCVWTRLKKSPVAGDMAVSDFTCLYCRLSTDSYIPIFLLYFGSKSYSLKSLLYFRKYAYIF